MIEVYCDICDKEKPCNRYDGLGAGYIYSCNECDDKYPHPEEKVNTYSKKENCRLKYPYLNTRKRARSLAEMSEI